ncbi:hypothetical protein Bca4012_099824 [Brassica carinata]
MDGHVKKKLTCVFKSFSLQDDECHYSLPFKVADCDWRLVAFRKRDTDGGYLSMYLELAPGTLPPRWRRDVEFSLTLVKQGFGNSNKTSGQGCFDAENNSWGFEEFLPLSKLSGHLVDYNLTIITELDVMPAIVLPEEPVKETTDVNGFEVLSCQVESVKRIFERHPDIAEEFYAKNQHLRNACMTFLLSLVETLCQSLEKLSNEDLVEADIALTYLKDAGFKVDWLEKKLDQLKDKKEKEKSCLARLQEIEEHLQKLKQKCSQLDALADDEKTDLSATRMLCLSMILFDLLGILVL